MARVRNVKATLQGDHNLETVLYPICMRSPAVHGRNLTAALDAWLEHGGHTMTVLICDALDRYNMPDSVDPMQQSLEDGHLWLEHNRPTLEAKVPNLSIISWYHDVLSHPAFEKKKAEVIRLYNSSQRIHDFIESLVHKYFLMRVEKYEEAQQKGRYMEEPEEEKYKSNSRQYLLEEMAGDMIVHDSYPDIPRIYWGLWIDTPEIFNEVSGRNDLSMPETTPISINRLSDPIPNSWIMRAYNCFNKELVFPETMLEVA